jgi:uncharacterized membrane protein
MNLTNILAAILVILVLMFVGVANSKLRSKNKEKQ